MALKQNLIHKVESLDYALSRAGEGLYGICEVCGNPIDPARLEAMPETTLCVGCKADQKRQPAIRAPVGSS
jgi:RNA polymerase-binding transcription factor DksA